MHFAFNISEEVCCNDSCCRLAYAVPSAIRAPSLTKSYIDVSRFRMARSYVSSRDLVKGAVVSTGVTRTYGTETKKEAHHLSVRGGNRILP